MWTKGFTEVFDDDWQVVNVNKVGTAGVVIVINNGAEAIELLARKFHNIPTCACMIFMAFLTFIFLSNIGKNIKIDYITKTYVPLRHTLYYVCNVHFFS